MKTLILHTFRRIMWMLLVLLDVIVNYLFNGRVETVSSRAGRARSSGRTWGCVLCRWLDDIDAGHCDKAMKDPLGSLD